MNDKALLACEKRLREYVTRTVSQEYWIGLGAAIEWIATRGREVPRQDYGERYETASRSLVDTLAGLATSIAESYVRGLREANPASELEPVPAGIWPTVSVCDAEDGDFPYRLIGTDDTEEWEGAILGAGYGYRRVQIQTAFLRDNWPLNQTTIAPIRKFQKFSMADLRKLIERILAETPPDLAPLAKIEICSLARTMMPKATITAIRLTLRDLKIERRRGPPSGRNADRPARLQEFGQKLLASKFPN